MLFSSEPPGCVVLAKELLEEVEAVCIGTVIFDAEFRQIIIKGKHNFTTKYAYLMARDRSVH